jgi:lipopolysaccharide/colanic/teichoic acid biosynthesis glycosyltransferase
LAHVDTTTSAVVQVERRAAGALAPLMQTSGAERAPDRAAERAVAPPATPGSHSNGAPPGGAALDAAPARARWRELEPRGWYALFGQRALDLVLAALIAPAALPLATLLLALNALQQRSLSMALFRQPRLGRRGVPFELLKLRTLHEDGTPHFRSWVEGRDAARVTPLGAWLRRTHLDELPNLWNVVRGELSFVGPRPEMIDVEAWAAAADPRFVERLALRPGVTGLAQVVQGYTRCDARAYRLKRALNELYRRRQSLAFDLAVLGLTVLHLARAASTRAASIGRQRRIGRTADHRAELGV